MTDITVNISRVKQQLPSSVKLVAVSKTYTADNILEAYNTGHRSFGENRVQELVGKRELLPPDIEWHLIGHLQSNKAKFIIPFIGLIQSVDSYKLLKIVDSEAAAIGRIVDCLLQIHIATEETKYGFTLAEIERMADSAEFRSLKNVRICGVMGMATFTSDREQVRKEFRFLADCFNRLKNNYFMGNSSFKEISAGMSDDYEIALEEGSTIVRIGSRIFGPRK